MCKTYCGTLPREKVGFQQMDNHFFVAILMSFLCSGRLCVCCYSDSDLDEFRRWRHGFSNDFSAGAFFNWVVIIDVITYTSIMNSGRGVIMKLSSTSLAKPNLSETKNVETSSVPKIVMPHNKICAQTMTRWFFIAHIQIPAALLLAPVPVLLFYRSSTPLSTQPNILPLSFRAQIYIDVCIIIHGRYTLEYIPCIRVTMYIHIYKHLYILNYKHPAKHNNLLLYVIQNEAKKKIM